MKTIFLFPFFSQTRSAVRGRDFMRGQCGIYHRQTHSCLVFLLNSAPCMYLPNLLNQMPTGQIWAYMEELLKRSGRKGNTWFQRNPFVLWNKKPRLTPATCTSMHVQAYKEYSQSRKASRPFFWFLKKKCFLPRKIWSPRMPMTCFVLSVCFFKLFVMFWVLVYSPGSG